MCGTADGIAQLQTCKLYCRAFLLLTSGAWDITSGPGAVLCRCDDCATEKVKPDASKKKKAAIRNQTGSESCRCERHVIVGLRG